MTVYHYFQLIIKMVQMCLAYAYHHTFKAKQRGEGHFVALGSLDAKGSIRGQSCHLKV